MGWERKNPAGAPPGRGQSGRHWLSETASWEFMLADAM